MKPDQLEIALGIPEDVMFKHFDILITAAAVGLATKTLTDEETEHLLQDLWSKLLRIGKRFLIDRPTTQERCEFTITVIEEALAIAKGNPAT